MRKAEAADSDSKKRDGEEQGVGKGTVESGRRTIEKKETRPDLNREHEDDESSLSLASSTELSLSHLRWLFHYISIFPYSGQ
jgi:hypothetical protein